MEEKEKKPGFFKRLVSGLTKTRDNIVSGIDSLFSGFSHIDDDFYEELEEILIMGDLGVRATESIIEDLQRKVKEQHIKEPAECKELLIESIKEQMKVEKTAYRFENEKSVVLVIGVNGVGKTTTVGKLDAVAASKARNADVLLVDTAGRLHNKKNLMNELGKINKILESEYPDAYRETLVVLDATTGQNVRWMVRQRAVSL